MNTLLFVICIVIIFIICIIIIICCTYKKSIKESDSLPSGLHKDDYYLIIGKNKLNPKPGEGLVKNKKLDTNIWNYQTGDGGDKDVGGNPQWGNAECQQYTKDNIIINKDNTISLQITQDENWKSARINTSSNISIQSGSIVIVRAKVPMVNGAWPAIWLVPYGKNKEKSCPQTNCREKGKCGCINSKKQGNFDAGCEGTGDENLYGADGKYGHWPNSGEIDIMEQLCDSNMIYSSIHSGLNVCCTDPKNKNSDACDQEKNIGHFNQLSLDNLNGWNVNQFVDYALVWEDDHLSFYYKLEKNKNWTHIYTYNKPDFNPSPLLGASCQPSEPSTDTSWVWPFGSIENPNYFYLILNLAVGGGWMQDGLPAKPDRSACSTPIKDCTYDSKLKNSEFKIHSVRVLKKK